MTNPWIWKVIPYKGGGPWILIFEGQDHLMLKRIYTMGLSHKLLCGKSQRQLGKSQIKNDIYPNLNYTWNVIVSLYYCIMFKWFHTKCDVFSSQTVGIRKSNTLWNRGVCVFSKRSNVCYTSKLHKSDIIVEQTILITVLEEY